MSTGWAEKQRKGLIPTRGGVLRGGGRGIVRRYAARRAETRFVVPRISENKLYY